MRTNRTVLLSGLILLGLAGFALSQEKSVAPASPKPAVTKPAQPASPASTTARPADYPIIGHLEKQDRSITIKSGPNSTLYSVRTTNGKILFDNVSIEQLRAQAPELHEFIKASVASSSGAKTDARVRLKSDAGLR